jgi:hypothetical protein
MKDFPRFADATFKPSFTLEQMKLVLIAQEALTRQINTDTYTDEFKTLLAQLEFDYAFKLPAEYLESPQNLKSALGFLNDVLTDEYVEVRSGYASVINEHLHQYCLKNFDLDVLAIPAGQKLRVLDHA